MEIKKVLLLTFFITVSFSLKATNYYINSVIGKDSNRGTAIDAPLQTMQPLLGIQLNPGDSVLFATGQKFTGMLSIINTRGVLTAPIVISYYP